MKRPNLLAVAFVAMFGLPAVTLAAPPPMPAPTAVTSPAPPPIVGVPRPTTHAATPTNVAIPSVRASGVASSPAQQADVLRRQADDMSRAVARAAGPGADAAATQYVRTKLHGDFSTLTEALGQLQHEGKLDPITEQRAMAAANRVLVAAARAHTDLGPDEQERVESLLGNARYRVLVRRHDTAVETEAGTTEGIVAALTTPDGTVGPILRAGGKPEPAFLKGLARGRSTQQIGFDELTSDQKFDLIQSQSEGRDFFLDRAIPGVIFRNGFDVRGGLLKRVEYIGPNGVDNFGGIEFHVREPGPASHTLGDAVSTEHRFGASAVSRHEHIPARIPASILKGDDVDRFRLVDFYRRVTVTAEMKAVLEGYTLTPVVRGNVIYFDFLHSSGLGQMNSHLASMARGRGLLSSEDLKMGAVGFRTGEMYGNEKMFGFEVRAISPKRSEGWSSFVDAVQKGLLTGSYGTVSRTAAAQWHAANVAAPGARTVYATVELQNRALEGLHYNRPISELMADAPAPIKALLTPELKNVLTRNAEKNYGLKMLVHDWSKDPVLAGHPGLAARVLGAQQKQLTFFQSVGMDERFMKAVVAGFVQESGLYDAFAASIGVNEGRTN